MSNYPVHGLRGWRPLNGRADACVWLLVIGQPVVAGLVYGL